MGQQTDHVAVFGKFRDARGAERLRLGFILVAENLRHLEPQLDESCLVPSPTAALTVAKALRDLAALLESSLSDPSPEERATMGPREGAP